MLVDIIILVDCVSVTLPCGCGLCHQDGPLRLQVGVVGKIVRERIYDGVGRVIHVHVYPEIEEGECVQTPREHVM